jgi:excisionase family DNA binding protein
MITSKQNHYSVNEAAAIAGLTSGYVRRLLREKYISGVKITERSWIIPENQLKKLDSSPTGKNGKPRIGK